MDANRSLSRPTDEDANNPFVADCPGRTLFNHLTTRWSVLLMLALVDGAMRFHELRDRVGGISEKMLSQTLKTLARDGLVRRLPEATVPPRVSYELTPLGMEVAAPLGEVARWVERRIPEVLVAQRSFDAGEP